MRVKRVHKGPSSGMGLTGSPCLPSSVEGVPRAASCQPLWTAGLGVMHSSPSLQSHCSSAWAPAPAIKGPQ